MFKVYDGQEKKKEGYLKLEQNGGDVNVIVCDDQGIKISCVLIIKSNGTYVRVGSVREGIGFQLDADGRIKLA